MMWTIAGAIIIAFVAIRFWQVWLVLAFYAAIAAAIGFVGLLIVYA